jgi:SAM-dependent methyltransferase
MSVSRKQDIAQRFSRAAAGYADFASLQAAIADTLLARSEVAGVVLDGGCGRGRESAQLAARAQWWSEVIALDMAPGMLAEIPGLAKIYGPCWVTSRPFPCRIPALTTSSAALRCNGVTPASRPVVSCFGCSDPAGHCWRVCRDRLACRRLKTGEVATHQYLCG